ncbi:hypothetical protein ACFQ2B_34535 [Streptomyces stramineus]
MAGIGAGGTFGRLGAVLRGSAGAYWTLTGLWVLLRAGTLAVGLLFQRLFDEIGSGGGVWPLIAWVAAIEGARLCLQFGVMINRLEPRVQYGTTARLRRELLGSALRGRGAAARTTPGRPCGSWARTSRRPASSWPGRRPTSPTGCSSSPRSP